MPPETIRLSQKAKDRLVVLKRRTGIEQWNILCRWALCRSLQEPTDPPDQEIVTDSNVEMAWSTFAGDYASMYEALIKFTSDDSVDSKDHLLAHIHRGINYLFSEVERNDGIDELVNVKELPS